MQTEDMTQKKKEASDRQDSIEIDLKRMTQEFYCESCDKRYKSVSEMSNHLSSYDHHHRKVRLLTLKITLSFNQFDWLCFHSIHGVVL